MVLYVIVMLLIVAGVPIHGLLHSPNRNVHALLRKHPGCKTIAKSTHIHVPESSSKLNMIGLTSGGVLPLVASTAAVAGVVAFHELGHFLAAKVQGIKITSFNVGYGPKLIAFNDSSDIEYALRAFPLGGYVAFPVNVERDEDGNVITELDDPDLIENRPPLQRLFVISAGVLANLLLTVLLSANTALTSGISIPVYGPGVQVNSIASVSSPAFQAGIRTKDIILQIDDQPVRGKDTVVQDFVTYVRTHEGKAIKLVVDRPDGLLNGKKSTLPSTVKPTTGNQFETVVVPTTTLNGKASIGVGISAKIEDVKVQKANNIAQAAKIGIDTTMKLVLLTWTSFLGALSTGFKGADVGGPLSVISTGSVMAATSPSGLIGFAAALSINLAVLNALPYPALDGGQFLYALAEQVTGRKLPREWQDRINIVAFLLLALFSLSTVFGDFDKFLSGAPAGELYPGAK